MPSQCALNLVESMGSVGWMVPTVLLGIQWSGNEVYTGLQKFMASDTDLCACVQFANLISTAIS